MVFVRQWCLEQRKGAVVCGLSEVIVIEMHGEDHQPQLQIDVVGSENWRGLAGSVERAEAVVTVARGAYAAAETHFQKATATFQHYRLAGEKADTLQYWGARHSQPATARAPLKVCRRERNLPLARRWHAVCRIRNGRRMRWAQSRPRRSRARAYRFDSRGCAGRSRESVAILFEQRCYQPRRRGERYSCPR